jgi:DHA3 family macrolide efflux protein-like MFS transporter
MRLLRALAHPQVRWLWGGQVFSAVGDEVYNVALVWYATSLLGTRAGYLSAIQAASIVICGAFAGLWMDHRDHRKVMIASDLARAVVVLLLPVINQFLPLNVALLLTAVIVVSSLSALFQPAMSGLLPQLLPDRDLLQASNGLMETTSRLARVMGPGLVGLLSRFVPLIHYFTIDRISFLFSAYSLHRVQTTSESAEPGPRLTVRQALLAGHHLVFAKPVVAFVVLTGAIAAATWLFIFPLGMTLLLREKFPADVSSLAMLVAAYGVGNILANVLCAGFTFHRPERWMFSGRVLGGIGFIYLSQAPTLHQMMLACALAATGGPLTDLGFVNLIQRHYRGRDVARVFRYTMVLGNVCLVAVYLSSADLFAWLSVPTVILCNACAVALTGIVGFLFC